MLLRNNHRGDAHGPALPVFHRHLALAVGPEVGDETLPAHLGHAHAQPVGDHDGHRHERGGLVAGEAEHLALVSRPLRHAGTPCTPSAISRLCSCSDTQTPASWQSMPNSGLS